MKKLAVAMSVLAGLSGFSATALAHQAGEVFIRAGSATVRTNAGSDNVAGFGSFQVDNNTQAGLTLSYMVTDNIGVELLAATPFRHKVGLAGVGTIATVRHLPPTLMAQWYFADAQSEIRPYLGAGINYTTFFNESFNDNPAVGTLALNNLHADDSWGVAAQAGVDYMINKNWLLNMSVWYVDINTKVKFNAADTSLNIKTRLDPWVFMFSAGYRF